MCLTVLDPHLTLNPQPTMHGLLCAQKSSLPLGRGQQKANEAPPPRGSQQNWKGKDNTGDNPAAPAVSAPAISWFTAVSKKEKRSVQDQASCLPLLHTSHSCAGLLPRGISILSTQPLPLLPSVSPWDKSQAELLPLK